MHIWLGIVGGWRIYYLQHEMLILPCLIKRRRIKCKKNSNKFGALISKLQLGHDEMSIKTHIQMEGEEMS